MNSKVINELAAQHQPTERDKLEFGNRLKSEHFISSVQESIDIINDCITSDCKKLINYNIYSIGFKSNPVLTMNLIDESVISSIYYIFQASNDKDNDTLGYYRTIIDEYLAILENNYMDSEKKMAVSKSTIIQLYNILDSISHLSFPVSETINEESFIGKLSNDYYRLMLFCCGDAKPHNKYFTNLEKFYLKRIKK